MGEIDGNTILAQALKEQVMLNWPTKPQVIVQKSIFFFLHDV